MVEVAYHHCVTVAEVLPLEPRSGEDLDKLRARLFEAAADLKLQPIATPQELATRLHRVMREMESIRGELRLLLHLVDLEASDFEDKVAKINSDLDRGWKPEGAPVDEVVERLRAARHE